MSQDNDEGSATIRTGRVGSWLRLGGGGLLLAMLLFGLYLVVKGDNVEDFEELRTFTSADHRDERCEVQAAFDAQATIREYFDDQGGLSDEQAEAMAPAVGLTPEDMRALVGTELFVLDFDCDVAVASSQEATVGLLLISCALGALGATAFSRLTRGASDHTTGP